MAIRVKLGGGESYIEHQQVKARLEALGLQLNPDNTLVESSASNVAGGLGAIQALAKDGILDADAVAQLRKQSNLLGRLTGKDLPISQKESNAWRSLGLELSGTASTLETLNREIRRTGEIDNSQFHRAGERIEGLMKRVGELSALSPDSAKLAKVSPEVLRSVANASQELSDAASAYQQTLSLFRTAMLEKLSQANGPEYRVELSGSGYNVDKRPGWFERMQINALAGSLSSALQALPVVSDLDRTLALPMGHR